MPKTQVLQTTPLFSTHLRPALLACAFAGLTLGCGQDPLQTGQQYLSSGDYASAVIELKNAVQSQPESAPARLALADALEFAYDPTNAEQHLRKAIEYGADVNVLLPRIATLMLDRNELEAVIREFKDRRLKSPEAESNLRALVAIAYLGQKRNALAQAQLQGATVRTPTVSLARAQLLLSRGAADQALAELDAPSLDMNASWWTLRARSRLHAAVGNPAAALNAIQAAHKQAPWHRGLTGETAELLLSANKLAEATALRDQLLKQASQYFWTHYIHALVLARQGRTDESHAAAIRVLAVSPEHVPAVLLAASAELQKGDVQMADSRLRKILQHSPDSVPALQMQATAQLQLRKLSEAQDTLQHGLQVAPTDPTLLSLQADLESGTGKPLLAMVTLEKLIAHHPGHAPALLRLSELKARQGKTAEALALLDKAMQRGRDDPRVRDQILSIAMRMGDAQRVQALADHALKSRPQDPQSHLVQAVARGYQQDTVGAWRATLDALDLKPGFDAALAALSRLATQPAQRKELHTRFQKAVDSRAATPQTYLAFARLMVAQAQDPADVFRLLEKGVAAHPGSTALRKLLVDEELRAGNTDAALGIAQTGAAVADAPAAATALLANTYERVGKSESAADVYRKLVASFPQRADWQLKLAELEVANNGTAQATTLLRGLMTERPFDSAAYIALARLSARDNPREALSIARQLGQHAPHQLTAMLLEGDVLAESGQVDQALAQFNRAAKAGAVPVASLRLVSLLDRSGRSASADEELAATLRKYPEDTTVLRHAAQRALDQGMALKAVALHEKIAAKNPGNPVVQNDLAWAQIQAKDPRALVAAQKAAKLMPDNPQVLDTLGMAQALAGQRAQALVSLRTAVNLAPAAALPRLHLAEQLLAEGDRKAATAMLQAIDSKLLAKDDQTTLAQLGKSLQP